MCFLSYFIEQHQFSLCASPVIQSRKGVDEIIALKIDKSKPLVQQIKKDNLVLIYLNDIGIYKIRAIHSFDGNKLSTYYYNEHGEKVMSTVGYSPESIRGIVKYKVGV